MLKDNLIEAKLRITIDDRCLNQVTKFYKFMLLSGYTQRVVFCTFDCSLDGLICMKNVLLDELQRSWPV